MNKNIVLNRKFLWIAPIQNINMGEIDLGVILLDISNFTDIVRNVNKDIAQNYQLHKQAWAHLDEMTARKSRNP